MEVELWEDEEKQKNEREDQFDVAFPASLWILDSESWTGLALASRQSLVGWKDEKLATEGMCRKKNALYKVWGICLRFLSQIVYFYQFQNVEIDKKKMKLFVKNWSGEEKSAKIPNVRWNIVKIC